MNDALKIAHAAICAEIEKLQAILVAMERAGAANPVAAKPRGPRAPTGTLELAIKGVLEAKGGLVNKEVRAKLVKNGYKYSLDPLRVGKTLARLVEAGELKVALNGYRKEYTLR